VKAAGTCARGEAHLVLQAVAKSVGHVSGNRDRAECNIIYVTFQM
jgi:hypothetical protein